MRRPIPSHPDYPVVAHKRATQFMDEFETLSSEYDRLLATQRIFLAQDDLDAAMSNLTRSEAVARRVEQCGRQLVPVHEALQDNAYAGPRSRELRARLTKIRGCAQALDAAIVQLGALCVIKRDAAANELGQEQAVAATRRSQGYGAPPRTANAIDIRQY